MLDHKIDLAIAWYASGNTSRYSLLIILDVFFKEFRVVLIAYEWLSENYRPNDKIFLFGAYRLSEMLWQC